MRAELDLPGLSIAESAGGSGASAVEFALLMEEYGRALVTSPLLSTSGLAAPAIAYGATKDAQSAWLPRLADGGTTATWALLGPTGEPDIAGESLQAVQAGSAWELHGARDWVLDGASADIILTVASTSRGPALFVVDSADAGNLTRTESESLDPTLSLAALSFARTPAQRLSGDDATGGLRRALAVASINVTALQLGCLSATLDMAVAYAATRTQFGRPIGGFQAIKHRCADVFIDTETTRWVVYHAAALASDPDTSVDELVEAAHLTCAYSASSSFRAVAHLLQILGGIGYTWEHPAHLHFKRATAAARLLGAPQHHLDAIWNVIDAQPSPTPSIGP
jgi:alkylation response protein AidB-like acyl-CoA dehydrogenase